MDTMLPCGVWPVVLTPFKDDCSIDWTALDGLIEWYLAAGAAGLFVAALSAELLFLSEAEKVAITRAAVRRVAGRVPVVAGAYHVGTIEAQAALVRRVADVGPDAVVLTACQLVPADKGPEEWMRALGRVVEETGGIRLGLYEMPLPYHRILTTAEMCWAASTGRVFFHKDTSCDIQAIRTKIDAIRGTLLHFYNANTPTLLDSLRAGGHGYSGIGANYFPELYVRLLKFVHDTPVQADALQQVLTGMDAALHRKYPAAAKAVLGMRGLPIRPLCRSMNAVLGEDDMAGLRGLMETAAEAARQLDIHLLPRPY